MARQTLHLFETLERDDEDSLGFSLLELTECPVL